ncbi:MAG: hypothetical protein ABI720_06450 [Actinomycetes bacterium]
MSGTLGIAPIRTAGIDGVHRVARAVAKVWAAQRRRGGLSTRWGVPAAVLVTVLVVSLTVSLAKMWVPA